MQNRRRDLNLAGLLIALGLLAGCFFFAIPAALSDNIFFAVGRISERPEQVVLYHDGQTYEYLPTSIHYDRIVDTAYQIIRKEAGVDESGWSETRFTQARTEGTAVEMIYNEPVKLPGSRVDIADTYRLFIPLEVFGWNNEVIFRGGHTMYWGLPIRVDSLDPLREVIADVLRQELGETE